VDIDFETPDGEEEKEDVLENFNQSILEFNNN